ncbi:L,D-transpeptidase [Paradevosia shaoguanensis]|uniref:L,D-transpeptidase n=1 Tax=Paradevosia shaoguanensis TaxID=1335043 RepID=UPI003C70F38C
MLRLVRAATCGLAILSALTLDAFAGQVQQYPWVYAPPPGMSVVAGRPANGLQLQARFRVNPTFLRQVVRVATSERAGTIVVDTRQHFLYFMLGEGKALRYGIGTAKTGFEWSGTHRITNKREWPDWTPPAEMLKRRPGLPRHMEGGENNPLGARALYIGSTLYRIHGTNEPWTIGGDVSSGCIRMTNDDVIDLFARVQIGTKVIVL